MAALNEVKEVAVDPTTVEDNFAPSADEEVAKRDDEVSRSSFEDSGFDEGEEPDAG